MLFDDPDVGRLPLGEPVETTWSVGELALTLGGLLRGAFPDEVWVRGEIQDLSRAPSGHVYFTLAEPAGNGEAGACLSVILSSRNKVGVNRALTRAGGGVRMTDGTDVRIRGRIDWYAPRGQLQLRMSAIDPAYTLGRLEVARAELIARLAAEGLLGTNAARPMPLVPLRIGLVTSRGSAAEADFVDELRRSGFAFDVLSTDTRVQGIDAPLEIAAAIARAAERGVDVIAVIRGGGARTDLMAFDDERVARAIASSPVPVITGIGHEVDRAVADEVAHTSQKTPTAAAQALVALVTAYVTRISAAWSAIAGHAARGLDDHHRRILQVVVRTDRASRGGLDAAARRLDARATRVAGSARAHLRAAETRTEDDRRRFLHRAPRALAEAEQVVGSIDARVRANDPERMLGRGWSITRTGDGRLVRSPAGLSAGDVLHTLVAHGEVRSAVVEASTVEDDE